MKPKLLFLVLWLVICLLARSVLALDIPQPVGYVNDFAGMLSVSFRQNLEIQLANFDKGTTNQIVVVTIDSLEDNSLEEYAVKLFEEWKIGQKDKDNGLLLLIVKDDRKIRIEVGYGLEPIITDGRAGRIIREQISPEFKKGNYEQGIQAAVEKIEQYLKQGEPAPPEIIQEKSQANLGIFILVVILLIYLFAFAGRSKRFWPGGVAGFVCGLIISFWLAIVLAVFGLLLDFVLSRNYKKLKVANRSTGFWRTLGGFSSGGHSSGGGGFSGGGGSSGGGGASGGW